MNNGKLESINNAFFKCGNVYTMNYYSAVKNRNFEIWDSTNDP